MVLKYIVVEYDYQYNDECYYMPEGEPYYVSSIFSSKEAAESFANDKNRNLVYSVLDYIDTYEEYPDLALYVQQIGGIGSLDMDKMKLPDNLTDEQAMRILELAGIIFYTVIEMEES